MEWVVRMQYSLDQKRRVEVKCWVSRERVESAAASGQLLTWDQRRPMLQQDQTHERHSNVDVPTDASERRIRVVCAASTELARVDRPNVDGNEDVERSHGSDVVLVDTPPPFVQCRTEPCPHPLGFVSIKMLETVRDERAVRVPSQCANG